MDEGNAALAIGKLLKEQEPFKILMYKYRIEKLKDDLEKMKKLKDSKLSKKILQFNKSDKRPVKVKIAELEATIGRLSQHVLEGVLVPITVQEHWEVQQYCMLQRVASVRTMPKGLTSEGRQDFDDTVEMTCNLALQAKHVQVVFKKKEKVNGMWERVFTMEDIIKLEGNLLLDILTAYYTAFQLTEEELKKSLAPTKKEV